MGNQRHESVKKSAEGIVSAERQRRPEFINQGNRPKMRKSREQRKRGGWHQMSIFDKPINEPTPVPPGGTGAVQGARVELLSRLGEQRTLTTNKMVCRSRAYVTGIPDGGLKG